MISDDIGIVQFDMDGKIVDCNDYFLELMGTDRGNAIGTSLLISLVNKEMWWTVLSALSGKPGCYTGDYVTMLGNRSLRLKATYARIKSLSGDFIGGLGIFEELDRSDG
ncbi:MAG: PAS domain-containing protein [Desulfobacteraceae bacterium]|nr:PAS domain-containing protein [Desulfobacteraceae bacterium]